MDKKTIPVALMLPLVILAILSHEYGHYYIAQKNGWNPEMHFFKVTEDTKNNSFFTQSLAYVSYKYPKNPESKLIEKKVLVAGLSFELFFLSIISGITFIIALVKKDWWLVALIGVIFAVILGIALEWNVFNIIHGTDLYYLVGG